MAATCRGREWQFRWRMHLTEHHFEKIENWKFELVFHEMFVTAEDDECVTVMH